MRAATVREDLFERREVSRLLWHDDPRRDRRRPGVLRSRDVADTRRVAAIDVVVEARNARVATWSRALAGPVAKSPVEHVERLAHLLRIGIRTEVDDAAPVPLAREHHTREFVLHGHRDVRERLVVAEANVERRPVALDEVLLEVQRLDLALRDDHLDVVHAVGQLRDRGAVAATRLEVRADAGAQGLRLADVEHLPAPVAEEVDARPRREVLELLGDALRRHRSRLALTAVSEHGQYVAYTFYRVEPAWRRLPIEERAAGKDAFAETVETFAAQFVHLRAYSCAGVRPDCDFFLWKITDRYELLGELGAALNATPLAGWLETPYSHLATTKASQYTSARKARKITPRNSPYLVVYPFVKTRPWYALPIEQRQRAMDEHIRIGAEFASIHNHTTYSFGIDDQEFMTAFECDEPADFMHLMLTLRETEASSYTERDTPIFVGQLMEVRACLDRLDGVSSGEPALERVPSQAATRLP